jgi:phycobilisome core-membrane linker protein
MSINASGGSPVTNPQRYQTLPMSVICRAEQQDRFFKNTEIQELESFFRSANKRLEIAETLSLHGDEIVFAGASRIFVGSSLMSYLEKPQDPIGLPGSDYYVGEDYLTAARRNRVFPIGERLKLEASNISNPVTDWWEKLKMTFSDREPLPGGFRFINVSRYGVTRMKRSMRDLAWFLRYITFAIVAGDTSILSVNARGLRGVIPEDVTVATVVALKDMRWKALSYFKEDAESQEIIVHNFDILISEYLAEKPSAQLRFGVSNEQQGLVLPQSYAISSEVRTKFVMKSRFSETEKQAVIKAAYRQVFERDVTATYGFFPTELESQVKCGQISMKEFIRNLGQSRLYLRLFYEPFTISRVIELAMRHFLGRGLSSLEEFQQYFAVITKGGFPKLVDTLVDSAEYADYFGEETVPYLRGLGQEAQECRNWAPQIDLFKYSAPVKKVPQFVTLFGKYQKPLPNQHPYGAGNDPLEIQFGAIFPVEKQTAIFPHNPAPFGKDNRRILISCDVDSHNGNQAFGKVPGSLGKIVRLDQSQKSREKNTNLEGHVASVVINAAYKQVFGRDVFDGQRIASIESKLLSGNITVREFVRQLAKSNLFRSLYWDKLYVTKAIEYIHRRLLGRPTYGRQEMNHYYDICATKGFYALIDEIIDSSEYIEVFEEDTVPYERYVTPRGLTMRLSKDAYVTSQSESLEVSSKPDLDSFVPSNHHRHNQYLQAELIYVQPENFEDIPNHKEAEDVEENQLLTTDN